MESRQVQRAQFRAEVKRGESIRKRNERAKKAKALAERKAAREKAIIAGDVAVSIPVDLLVGKDRIAVGRLHRNRFD